MKKCSTTLNLAFLITITPSELKICCYIRYRYYTHHYTRAKVLVMHYAIKALFCMANLGRFVSSTNQDNAQYNLDVVGTFWNFLSFSGQQVGIERSDDSNMVHRRPLIIALTLWSMANLANSGQASIGSRFETSKFSSFF